MNNLVTVLRHNGMIVRSELFLYGGACMVGEPTAYVVLNGETVWVVPGTSVQFIEA